MCLKISLYTRIADMDLSDIFLQCNVSFDCVFTGVNLTYFFLQAFAEQYKYVYSEYDLI